MNAVDILSLLFELCGFGCFLVSIIAWGLTFRRARREGILDYSMFALHPVFLLCVGFTAVMLFFAIRYFLKGDVNGFRTSIGAAVIFLSLLVWNTGFVTKSGLYLTGTKRISLVMKRENGLILLIPQEKDFRAARPIIYENTPENREKFSALTDSEVNP